MVKGTLRQKLELALLARGGVLVPERCGKYQAYRVPGFKQLVFVGTNGALRTGPCSSQSYSLTQYGPGRALYETLVEEGYQALERSKGSKGAPDEYE